MDSAPRWLAALAGVIVALGPATAQPDKNLTAEAEQLSRDGYRLYSAGKLGEAVPVFEKLLAVTRKLYPPADFPAGHPQTARVLNNLGVLYQSVNQLPHASAVLEEALAIRRRLYPADRFPDGHPDLAATLTNLGTVNYYLQRFRPARDQIEGAVAMRRKLFPRDRHPDGHPSLAADLNTLGSVYKELGDIDQARAAFERSLAMFQALFPKDRHPAGRPELVNILNNLGLLLWENGQSERGRDALEQAVAMCRSLFPADRFPNGHPLLATSLGNLGLAFESLRNVPEAAKCFHEALAVEQALTPTDRFPHGTARIASRLHNLGHLRHMTGDLEKGKELYTQALDMLRRAYPPERYPNGHPDVALALNNLGYLAQDAGDLRQAEARLAEAMAMYRTLYPADRYPDGHAQVAVGHNNLASVHLQAGAADRAYAHVLKNLHMRRALFERLLASASDAEAVAIIDSDRGPAGTLLSVTAGRPEWTAEAYRTLWPFRAMVTRALEARHIAQRTAGSQVGDTLNRLRAVRQGIEHALQAPAGADRDRRLAALNDESERLQRDLAVALPTLDRLIQQRTLEPNALSSALPAGGAFVDLVEYVRTTYDPAERGRTAERKVRHYAAFVISHNAAVKRVDLGPSAAVDGAIGDWRKQIESRQGDREAAARVHALVWAPIARLLSQAVRTIYVSADGDLARVPWAALPTGAGRVLAEDAAVAVVPHGAFLLDQLASPRQPGANESALVVGDVVYSSAAWPELPGSRVEAAAVRAVAPGRLELASQRDATAARVREWLPKVGYAHFATHGQFQADEFAAAKKRELESRTAGRGDAGRRAAAAKNPLGFVGLVLSGGAPLSGLSIVDLDLSQTRLVTLSACETGLGQFTGGKGVETLQLAFHLAGCPNVVASLWKVNDVATAALMAKFYHELWVNRKPPIEALRQAQLTIYRHPELIPDLAGERGAPRLKAALAGKTVGASPAARTADTRLWAAFVLSGVGR